MANQAITEIWQRFIQGAVSPGEKVLLCRWIEETGHEAALQQLLENSWNSFESPGQLPESKANEMLSAILSRAKNAETASAKVIQLKSRNWKRLAIAVAVVLLAGVATYFFLFNKAGEQSGIVKEAPTTIEAPKTARAMITLANGNKVYLDSTGNGQLALQGNVKLVKLADGQIAYQTATGEVLKEMQYNTLFNPRGSKVVDLVLADGSHVWLNAGSSVTYPIAFINNERKVSVTGEAYFEVMHNAAKPFYVTKGDMQVQVLGTHFNVNAYDDEEAIRVTLLEGSVRVKSEAGSQKSEITIKPGEQAIRTTNHQLQTTNNINIEQVMAWKNGFFSFSGSDLPVVMRQLARWYDIQVTFEGTMPGIVFKGKMDRGVLLSDVLEFFNDMNISSRIEGRTLILSNKKQ